MRRLGHLNHWTEDPSLLDEASTSIRELDSFQKVLSSYLTSIQETVDALRGAVRPFSFGNGIDTLPDEILSIIFESLGPDWSRCATRTLNLVSRRFRHVVLNTPRLWCDVSTGMSSMDDVIRHLERSKSTGLNVDVVPSPLFSWETPCLDQLDVFDAVLTHARRWERFAVDIGLDSKPLNLRERLNNLTHLPRLKELCLECYGGVVEVVDPSFLDSLCAPQLRRLCIINCAPGPSALFSTLTSLEILIWDFNGDHQLSHSLCMLLASIPNLTEASLNLKMLPLARRLGTRWRISPMYSTKTENPQLHHYRSFM